MTSFANKSQAEIKKLLIDRIEEYLSYLLSGSNDTSDMEQVSEDKNRDIAKLLTSIISDINLVKELLTEHKGATKQRRKREYDTILQLIDEEARKGNFYTKTQFCYFFEDKLGLKSHHSIRRYINALATEGYIKFREKASSGNSRLRVKVMEALDERGHCF